MATQGYTYHLMVDDLPSVLVNTTETQEYQYSDGIPVAVWDQQV
jgi:hypothetical protein